MIRYAPDYNQANPGHPPISMPRPSGMYGYIMPHQPMEDPPMSQSPFQDSGIGEFLRRLRGYGQFQPVNLFQPAAMGINLQGTFGGGT